MYEDLSVKKVLVIAPKRVAESTWATEADKWDHTRFLTISKVLGSRAQRERALLEQADIYVINRENVEWLVSHLEERRIRWPFDMVVIDELSSFKSTKAIRFRKLKKVRPLIKRIVGLTGTPAPNGYLDLWPQVYLLDQGERLGKSFTQYREAYFLPKARNRTTIFSWASKPGAEEAINNKISDLCLSMSAEDYLDLPERVDVTIPIELPAKVKAQMEKLERDEILKLEEDSIITINTAATLTNKFLQMANGAIYDDDHGVTELHEEKLAALKDLTEEVDSPVLVFYAFRHDLERIRKRFPEARTLDSPEDIESWNRGEIRMLLAHPASAGHGLNLQAGGNVVIWFGLTWSLELYQQANARLHRQGQQRGVIVHHLIAKGTMDEEVMKSLTIKDYTQSRLIEAIKARIEAHGRT